ncbi:MAG: sugar transferase, partial [Deltaproteobacteria bacterium]|nr:sugar transferase [Deltaproteobacteria bacterium]
MKATKDQEDMLYSEEFFQEILSLERKRTDRYNRPFILVLINFSNIDAEDERKNLIQVIAVLLNQITRETDIKGWYQQNSVLGILFTEIDDEKTDVINQLKKRFSENMRESKRSGKWDAIDISYQGYPTDVQYIEENGENLVFYPKVVQDREEGKVGPFIKRFMDISISLVTLVFFLPLFLVISMAIKMTSPGSVFFRQERLGLYGKKFSMLKFRTMTVNNDHEIHRDFVNNLINGHHEEGKPLKITNDSRVTKVGWFLRKSSLDELPQLINVLKGEMSLVGPRPP